MIDNSSMVEFSAVERLEDKAKQRALIANVAFGVAGACAVAAAVFYFTVDGDSGNKERRTTLTPTIGPDSVGVSAAIRF